MLLCLNTLGVANKWRVRQGLQLQAHYILVRRFLSISQLKIFQFMHACILTCCFAFFFFFIMISCYSFQKSNWLPIGAQPFNPQNSCLIGALWLLAVFLTIGSFETQSSLSVIQSYSACNRLNFYEVFVHIR